MVRRIIWSESIPATLTHPSFRTLAVTPSKSKDRDFGDVTKICSDFTIYGLRNMATVANTPFRFIYTSGVASERDQSKSLSLMADYRLMRVRFTTILLSWQRRLI
jgi:hypothetical protein